MNSPGKLQSVQALRGIAAFLVLIFHGHALQLASGQSRSGALGMFWEQGYAGVDLFFVISGFIMVYVTQTVVPSATSAGQFLYARMARIYPLWWVFASLMGVYFWVSYGQPAAPDRVSGDEVSAYLIKSFLLLPQQQMPVLGLGWTLIHEMLFYVIFALGLLVSRRLLPVWLGIWAILIVLVSFGDAPSNHVKNMSELLTSPLNLEFILGAIAALTYLRLKTPKGSLFLAVGVIGFTAALLIGVTETPGLFVWKRVLVYGVPGAILLLGAVLMEREGRLSVPGWLSRIGDWSYSLYLVHMLVLLALRRFWKSADEILPSALKFGADGALDNILFMGLGIALSLLASFVSFHVIERPALKLLRRKRL